MAGDWMKFEKATLAKPEVFQISGDLKIDADAVVGKLLRVWDWFDSQSRDGHAPVTLMAHLDRLTGVNGFCEAMGRAGWLNIGDAEITLPNFERHNGQSAKKRALANTRKHRQRARGHADGHASSVTEEGTETGPEKRREENPLLFPQGETPDRYLPKDWRSMSKEKRKRQRVLQNSPAMVTIGKFFGRRPETLWTVEEAVALKDLAPSPKEIELLSKYYHLELDRDRDFRRRDLPTLLNNWACELDRAHSHFASNPS